MTALFFGAATSQVVRARAAGVKRENATRTYERPLEARGPEGALKSSVKVRREVEKSSEQS